VIGTLKLQEEEETERRKDSEVRLHRRTKRRLMASLSGPIAFRQHRDPTAYLPHASASFRPVADDLPEIPALLPLPP